MNIIDIIQKKEEKKELTKDEISFFIKGYTAGNIPDYQASALIMAIFLNGMTDREVMDLTLEMAYSGDVLDLSSLGTVVDKHSTGGVGDKITLILAPIIASLGIPVAKMSGRGLGFTGGTVDKLESIPGYKTVISIDEFINNVKKIGISLIGQSGNLAPADKKIYALRDTISCVQSIPLIVSSIMSKKIASGADKIVLDVTYGSGAFMKTYEDAKKLASKLEEVGSLVNKKTVCVITSMEQPLGHNVGNNLEVIEAVEALKGNMADDVKEVIFALGGEMINLAKSQDAGTDNKAIIEETIKSGKALDKFKQLVQNQGGDVSFIDDTSKFAKSKYIVPVYAEKQGKITTLDAEKIGKASCKLGAGRERKEDSIDLSAGIVLDKKVGDLVNSGDILAYLHTNKEKEIDTSKAEVLDAYIIS